MSFLKLTGEVISTTAPASVNNVVWWDADLTRELSDGVSVTKWDPATRRATTLLTATGSASNNSTKSNSVLSGDILGDWREEVIWRSTDNTELRIYTTVIPAQNRIYTLMHDPQYREAIAWQNNCYNQPPHPSFFIGHGMSEPPVPNIVTTAGTRPEVVSVNRQNPATASTNLSAVTFRVTFSEQVGGVDASDFALTTTGTASASVASVTSGSGAVIDVTVNNIKGDGALRLDLKGAGTGIADNEGNPLFGGFFNGQSYNVTSSANGVVMSRTNGSNTNNVSQATFSGGTSTIEKFTLGFDSTANAGSATILVNGGALYVGSGGIVKRGGTAFSTNVNLTAGTLGAAVDWSTSLPLSATSSATTPGAASTSSTGTLRRSPPTPRSVMAPTCSSLTSATASSAPCS